jgi:hypothetical protein
LTVASEVLFLVIILICIKYSIHYFKIEFLSVNSLTSSAIAGGVFICSFLLSGVISDYKEAEKIPSELRSSIENILDEGKIFYNRNNKFKYHMFVRDLKNIVTEFFLGLSHEKKHDNLKPCLLAVDKLNLSFGEMEKLGMLPNFLVRIKTEYGNIRKNILRVYHIQRTQFIPSAYILGISIVVLIIFVLLFIKTEGSPESMIFFGFISYMFIYIISLISIIEQPYQEGESSMDDISMFLLHELDIKLTEELNAKRI